MENFCPLQAVGPSSHGLSKAGCFLRPGVNWGVTFYRLSVNLGFSLPLLIESHSSGLDTTWPGCQARRCPGPRAFLSSPCVPWSLLAFCLFVCFLWLRFAASVLPLGPQWGFLSLSFHRLSKGCSYSEKKESQSWDPLLNFNFLVGWRQGISLWKSMDTDTFLLAKCWTECFRNSQAVHCRPPNLIPVPSLSPSPGAKTGSVSFPCLWVLTPH